MTSETQETMHLSFLSLIANADVIVQGVMAALAVASVVCWTLGFEKLIRFTAFSLHVRRLERFMDAKTSASWLAQRFETVARAELRVDGEGPSQLKAHIESSLHAENAAHLRRLQAGLPLLATVGSTAPFVGLFGTVWGILNSFTGIAAAKDTSLAVVAPGIAEALLATAIGLVAAIPAVIIYNLANVYLSNAEERLTIAAARFAKLHAYGGAAQTARGA